MISLPVLLYVDHHHIDSGHTAFYLQPPLVLASLKSVNQSHVSSARECSAILSFKCLVSELKDLCPDACHPGVSQVDVTKGKDISLDASEPVVTEGLVMKVKDLRVTVYLLQKMKDKVR